MVGAKEHKAAVPYPTLLTVIEMVADWAELRSVDYGIFRDGDTWTLQLKFSDAHGPFSAHYELPEACNRVDLMYKRLDKLCVETRRGRLVFMRFCH